jgi:hypothetical protein
LSILGISASAAAPRRSASSSGSLPNQRPSGSRLRIETAVSSQRSFQPITSYTV